MSAHNCPSCGAKIKSKNAAVCEYCGTSLSASISVGGSTADGQNKILAPELRKLLQRHVQLQDENRKNQPLISISSKQKDKINPETSCLCEIFDNELLFENVERAGMAISFYFERNSQELLRFSNSSYYNIFRHDESAPSNTLSYCLDAGRNVERAEKVITDILSEVYLIGEESELEYTTDFYKFSSSQGSSEFDDDEDEGLSLRTKVYIGLFVIFLIIQLTRCVGGNSDVPSQPPASTEAVDAPSAPIAPADVGVREEEASAGEEAPVLQQPSTGVPSRSVPADVAAPRSSNYSYEEPNTGEFAPPPVRVQPREVPESRSVQTACQDGTPGIGRVKELVRALERDIANSNEVYGTPNNESSQALRDQIRTALARADQNDCWVRSYRQ